MSNTLRFVKPWAMAIALASWSLAFVACVTTERSPSVAYKAGGGKMVGSQECATCHEEVVAKFENSTHSRLAAKGADASHAVGCEACHGSGAAHVKAGGGKGSILNPAKSPDTCFKCHLEKRGEFSLPHSHPVLAGKMSCGECHDPHSGGAIKGGGSKMTGENETCLECHTAQKGPFVFEHNAMREGCTVCHSPHGSVNTKMLKERDINLCLKCHVETAPTSGTIQIGGGDHGSRVMRGTCWTSGCHENPHGSNASKTFRY